MAVTRDGQDRRRAAASTLATAGAVALAIGLISTVHAAAAHLEARDRWLVMSSQRDHPAYDARHSDARYERAARALDDVVSWSRLAGLGLLLLAAALPLRLARRGGRAPRARLLLRVLVSLGLGAAAWLALRQLGASVADPRAGPLAESLASTLAPFVGGAVALATSAVRPGLGPPRA